MTSNENTQVDPVMHRWFHDQGPLISAAAEVIGDAIPALLQGPGQSGSVADHRHADEGHRPVQEHNHQGRSGTPEVRTLCGPAVQRFQWPDAQPVHPHRFQLQLGSQCAEAEETMTDITLTTQDYSDLPKLPQIIRSGWVTGPRLPSGHRFVLITLCNYANEAGEFYLDTAAVAWDYDMNTATVYRVVHDLARLGLIRFEIVQETYQEQLTHCQLPGARRNWTPQPKDPGPETFTGGSCLRPTSRPPGLQEHRYDQPPN